MTDLKALIEKQREKLAEVVFQSVDVVVGGEKVTLDVEKLHPDEWDVLVAENPPRRGVDADNLVGYNPKAMTAAYPRIRVGDELLSAETWRDLYGVLDSVWRNQIEVTIWGVNVNESLKVLRGLGKARAGRKSPSPAN